MMGLLLLLLILSPVIVSADQQQQVHPWVGILIVFLSLVFLVISVIVLLVVQRYGFCCDGAAADNHHPQPQAAVARGMDKTAIASLRTLRYSEIKMRRLGQGELECAVCLHDFEDDEKLCLLPNCCHVFHPHCITPWLASRATCPVCRACFECGQGSGVTTSNVPDHQVVDIEGSSSQVNHHNCAKLLKCHSTGQLQGRVLGEMIGPNLDYEMSPKSDYRSCKHKLTQLGSFSTAPSSPNHKT